MFACIVLAVFAIDEAIGIDTLVIGPRHLPRMIQPTVLALLSLSVFALMEVSPDARLQSLRLDRLPHATPIVVALVVFVVCAAIARFSLLRVPLSGDEAAYLFQADLLAHGHTFMRPRPAEPLFAQTYIFVFRHHLLSQYPPGWPAMLAVAELVHLPAFLLNPLLGACLVLELYRFARNEFGRETALAAILATAATPFFLFNSASFYNGNATALAGVLFVDAARTFRRRPAAVPAAATGLLLSVLALIRHLDAVLFALPMVIAFVVRADRRHWRLAPVAIAASLPLLAALFAYYRDATGIPFAFPQTLRNPADGLFGPSWHLARVDEITVGRLVELAEWSSPILVMLGVWAYLRRDPGSTRRPFDAIPPLFLLGYWMYWADGGLRWGPRYLYPAFPFLVLAIAAPACAAAHRRHLAPLRLLAIASLAGVLQLPALALRAHQLVSQTRDVQHEVRAANLHGVSVLLLSGTGRIWFIDTGDLVRAGAVPGGDILLAHPAGPFSRLYRRADIDDAIATLRRRWPDRPVWLYRRDPGRVEGTLTPAPPRL